MAIRKIDDLDFKHMTHAASVMSMLVKFKINSAVDVADDVRHTLKNDFCEYCETHKWGDCPCFSSSKAYED